jgi:hypothetical protein
MGSLNPPSEASRDLRRQGWEIISGDWPQVVRDRKGGDMAEWPEDLRVREFPAVRA